MLATFTACFVRHGQLISQVDIVVMLRLLVKARVQDFPQLWPLATMIIMNLRSMPQVEIFGYGWRLICAVLAVRLQNAIVWHLSKNVGPDLLELPVFFATDRVSCCLCHSIVSSAERVTRSFEVVFLDRRTSTIDTGQDVLFTWFFVAGGLFEDLTLRGRILFLQRNGRKLAWFVRFLCTMCNCWRHGILDQAAATLVMHIDRLDCVWFPQFHGWCHFQVLILCVTFLIWYVFDCLACRPWSIFETHLHALYVLKFDQIVQWRWCWGL